MRPPALAHALIAAVAPAADYEIIAGDLHEEYLRIERFNGKGAADRWYWAQTLFSIPPLLSYSRSNDTALRYFGVALISLVVLFAMLAVIAELDSAFFVTAIPAWMWPCIYNGDAAVFGAILARLVRTDGLRVTFFASSFLVLCFVVPALAGHPGSQTSLAGWIQVFAAVPVMCSGAAIYQVAKRGAATSN
jgi:hypothetical protein